MGMDKFGKNVKDNSLDNFLSNKKIIDNWYEINIDRKMGGRKLKR